MDNRRGNARGRPPEPGASRRRALRLRAALALVLIAAGGVIAAVALGGGSPSPAVVAERYARDWAQRDYAQLYAYLDERSRASLSYARFLAEERRDAAIATLAGASAGAASAAPDGRFLVPVRVRTRMFRTLYEDFTLTITSAGGTPAVAWDAASSFPGLSVGERLKRVAIAPSRGILLARDGTPLAQLASAANVIGTVGQAHGAELRTILAEGFPASTPVGLDGLELLFQRRLGGAPGGALYAGQRLLAATAPHAGADVRTSISPPLQTLATSELESSAGATSAATIPYGASIAVMDPATGELLAAAGTPLSELQPPGSTFKIVTLTGLLEAHLSSAETVFPYSTAAVLDGFTLHNDNGESCGGTLANAFAVSCNSVFAPLGARLGADRLLAAATTYGFNSPSPIPIAAESTIPAGSLGDDLQVGSSAIGQGQVLASPLQMLRVAATIALVGRRPVPTFAIVPPRRFPRVIGVSVARTIRALMRDVVVYGTGTGAQIPGVAVAGKTGTAQVITPTCNTGPSGPSGATGASGASGPAGATGCPTFDNNPADTDAWFVAFAPEIRPRIVVAVLVPNAGVGGTTAAPLAKAIIEQALAP